MRLAAVVVLLGACGRLGFDSATRGNDASSDGVSDADPDAPDRPNRIFWSTGTYTGNLGGIAGAGQKCQVEADAATLGGTWVALLYTLADDPSARVTGSRGWVDLDGTPIGDTPASLVLAPFYPLRIDRAGSQVTQKLAWWGGHPPGSGTCMDWTTTATDANGTNVVESDSSFHTDVYSPCSAQSHLMCAEVGHVARVAPTAQPGRNAFVSRTKVTGSIGLSGADMVCQTEANAAQLTGMYRAYLTTATAPADGRFSTTGLPWRRVDGVLLTAMASQLFGSTPQDPWDTFIARYADGTETNERAWTGTTLENCVGWTSASNSINGQFGSTHSTRRGRLASTPSPCNSPRVLLCFEN
jgi:hypothetical protein